MKAIKDGVHTLTGVGRFQSMIDYSEVSGIVLQIDGRNYAATIDHDDGYRSYGDIVPTRRKPSVTFPAQEVVVDNIPEKGEDEDGWPVEYDKVVITNPETGKIIIEVGTDHSDMWYPVAIFHYYPENLPINANK